MVCALLFSGCAARHLPPGQAVFRIDSRGGAMQLIPPSSPGGIAAEPIPFSQVLAKQYGFNPWEQYVDLSQGMRLAVLRTTGPTQTASDFYEVVSAGRGYRVRNLTPRARYIR